MDELRAIGFAGLAVKVVISARAELLPALEKVEKISGAVQHLGKRRGYNRTGGVLDQTPEDWD